ncbi:MAG: hypothetical protein ACHP85_11015 [Burkholderiales bacterium]|jgi:hypothetical protein
MTINSASRLAFVLLAALLLPACGDDTPTNPGAARAAIGITVDPTPVPPSQNTLTGTVSIGYRITITELNGLGGELQFVSSQVYDPETGLLAGLTYFDGADLIVFVGKKTIDPGGTLVVPQTQSYLLPDFRTKALLAINVQLKDDKDNVINQSVLVKVE